MLTARLKELTEANPPLQPTAKARRLSGKPYVIKVRKADDQIAEFIGKYTPELRRQLTECRGVVQLADGHDELEVLTRETREQRCELLGLVEHRGGAERDVDDGAVCEPARPVGT